MKLLVIQLFLVRQGDKRFISDSKRSPMQLFSLVCVTARAIFFFQNTTAAKEDGRMTTADRRDTRTTAA
jgi:hypothetical protein